MQLRYVSPPALSEHFEGHAKLEAVIYPGLPGHPGHEIAGCLSGFGETWPY
jgi:cystathionine gamma-synthase